MVRSRSTGYHDDSPNVRVTAVEGGTIVVMYQTAVGLVRLVTAGRTGEAVRLTHAIGNNGLRRSLEERYKCVTHTQLHINTPVALTSLKKTGEDPHEHAEPGTHS